MSLKELKQNNNDVKISEENFFEIKNEKDILKPTKQKEEEELKKSGRPFKKEKNTMRVAIGFTDREMYQISEKTRGLSLAPYFKSIILKELGLLK